MDFKTKCSDVKDLYGFISSNGFCLVFWMILKFAMDHFIKNSIKNLGSTNGAFLLQEYLT